MARKTKKAVRPGQALTTRGAVLRALEQEATCLERTALGWRVRLVRRRMRGPLHEVSEAAAQSAIESGRLELGPLVGAYVPIGRNRLFTIIEINDAWRAPDRACLKCQGVGSTEVSYSKRKRHDLPCSCTQADLAAAVPDPYVVFV